MKLKYLADNDFKELSGEALRDAISASIRAKDHDLKGSMASQGTTPRQLTDLIGSLCDPTSGSGDKGTPVVLVRVTSTTIPIDGAAHKKSRLYAPSAFCAHPFPEASVNKLKGYDRESSYRT